MPGQSPPQLRLFPLSTAYQQAFALQRTAAGREIARQFCSFPLATVQHNLPTGVCFYNDLQPAVKRSGRKNCCRNCKILKRGYIKPGFIFLKDNLRKSVILEIEVKILNRLGLHARPAALVAQCAGKYEAAVSLIPAGGGAADAKSILSLLMLGAPCGSVLTLQAEGCDAEEAATAIAGLFAAKFDEE